MIKKSIFDGLNEDFDIDRDSTFDIKKADLELNSSDPVAIILRGHLYIENSVDEIIITKLQFPNLIKLSEINFSNKAKLCAALGIIDQRTLNISLKINKIRNLLAHKLENDLSPRLAQELLEEFDPVLRKHLISDIEKLHGTSYENLNPTLVIALLLKAFVGFLQATRHLYKVHLQKQERAQKIILKAAKAYDNISNGRPAFSNTKADSNV